VRILIDILHPAHVHVFRNFFADMTERGHQVCITARNKDRSIELLDAYDLPYQQISTQKSGGGLVVEMAQRTVRLLGVMRRFRPDVMTGIMGPSIALAGAVTRVPAVVFYDTEFAVQTNRFVYPLAYSVCTPDCYQGRVRGRHIQYPGYHELAYLHPNRFQKDSSRLSDFGVIPGEPYSIVRFVSWQAVHDRNERGLTAKQKRQLVEQLQSRGRVLISSEAPLPAELSPFAVRGPVEEIHHLTAFAQLVVGESATMASEAAVLGVPAVFIATTSRGYIDDEERRYGLVRHFTEDAYDMAVSTIDDLLVKPREDFEVAYRRLLEEKVDVTAWMVEYFENLVTQGVVTGSRPGER
jgi:predicted glycosyltransferase